MDCDSERNKDKQHAEWIRESVLGQCGKFEFYALLSGSQWRYLRMSIIVVVNMPVQLRERV